MMRFLLLFLFLAYLKVSTAQSLITGSYSFQSDANKKYALYIPSQYDDSKLHKAIIGLHPLNVARWNAESWCRELAPLAEANNTLVICPDGGPDGRIDDPIDTAFTSFLIEEMKTMYSIDADSLFGVGFSWGGKTVYTYGLNHPGVFAGFMPIGAAVRLNDVAPLSNNIKDENFYVIHGSNDDPAVRFNPLLDLLENYEACVESEYLIGVGHTIDFPNQFEILNTAFRWLISNACSTTLTKNEINREAAPFLKRTLYQQGETLQLKRDLSSQTNVSIIDLFGRLYSHSPSQNVLHLKLDRAGVFIVTLSSGQSQKILVLDY